MKIETGLPALAVAPGESDAAEAAERTSLSGTEASSQLGDGRDASASLDPRDPDSASLKEQSLAPKKRGMFGALISKKPGQTGPEGVSTQKQAGSGPSGSPNSLNQPQQAGQRPTSPAERKDDVQRVRVAAFMAIEVRGRSVLVKAPVWTL